MKPTHQAAKHPGRRPHRAVGFGRASGRNGGSSISSLFASLVFFDADLRLGGFAALRHVRVLVFRQVNSLTNGVISAVRFEAPLPSASGIVGELAIELLDASADLVHL
jgi:hypothetical protein